MIERLTGFTKSEEGVREFAKLDMPYPTNLMDELYEKWLQDTDAERLSQYSNHTEKEVTRMTRVKTREGKEFIVYHFSHYRLDRNLNVTQHFRSRIGIYPIPRPKYSVNRLDFGKEQRTISEIIAIDKAYSIL
jgi:hypothetical protein